MATFYRAKASVVKVSIGPSTGNRVARIITGGGIIPEGVEQEQLDRLAKLKLIEKVTVADEPTEAEAKAAADAEAKAKADEAAKAKAAADAKAKADAEAKAAGK
jgi:colicin import membrane protein